MTAQDTKLTNALTGAIKAGAEGSQSSLLGDGAPFDPAQKQWLDGLFAGLQALVASAAAEGADDAPATALSVLYGSQSGNCEALSKDLRKIAKARGFDAAIKALDDVTPADLADMEHLLIVAATFGEGEPTDNAQKFHAALMADDAPALPQTLNYSVCGLGDSAYADFNQAARDLDARLAELGASRAAPMVACDVDFEDDFKAWAAAAFDSAPFAEAAGAASGAPEPAEARPDFDKAHPFMASLMVSDCLSGDASAKCVNHIEISLAGGGPDLEYEAGDALGVYPLNDPADVAALLQAAGLTGREAITLKTGQAQLRAALQTRLDIITVTGATLEAFGLEAADEGAQVIDLVTPDLGLTAQQLVDGLRPLQPRLYSISSSPKAHPGEVHLTVGEVRYELNGTPRKGVASTYLGERMAPGAMLGVYMQRSAHFHLPEDDETPLIMIGPGTGIAPFRAFLEEREARGATGRNWLFFGDQHESCDYLYRDSIEAWSESGLLTKKSLAWSRDGADKVYVQTLLAQDGAEVFAWLEAGAAIYICGDASRMAADVERTLLEIFATHGGMDEAGALDYLAKLSSEHRYQRDVY